MVAVIRHILAGLIFIAFSSGAGQAAPQWQMLDGRGAAVQGASAVPCDQMADMQGTTMAPERQDMPCKGLTPECVKQMGCVTIPAVAERFVFNSVNVSYTRVVYWSLASDAEGLSSKPDLLPPRTS
jgi:hypothetical protein